MDEDCILSGDFVLGGQLHLYGTEGESIDALEERDNERTLAGDAAHLPESRYDHQFVRRAFAPAALEHHRHDQDADDDGEQVEDYRFEKHAASFLQGGSGRAARL